MTEVIQSNLPELAGAINRAQSNIESLLNEAVENAVAAGNALIEAKSMVNHGEWQNWVSANCRISDRTARSYMRLARELPKLDYEKRQQLAVLPLRDVIADLATPKEKTAQTECPPFDIMVDALTPQDGKWLFQETVSNIGSREFTFIIPRGTRKRGHTYQLVSMHGLNDGTGFIEAVKPIYSFGLPTLLWALDISTAPLDWGVIDAVPELEKAMTA